MPSCFASPLQINCPGLCGHHNPGQSFFFILPFPPPEARERDFLPH